MEKRRKKQIKKGKIVKTEGKKRKEIGRKGKIENEREKWKN